MLHKQYWNFIYFLLFVLIDIDAEINNNNYNNLKKMRKYIFLVKKKEKVNMYNNIKRIQICF